MIFYKIDKTKIKQLISKKMNSKKKKSKKILLQNRNWKN